MRIEKRIRALESRMVVDPVVLYFSDGSTRRISGPSDFLLSLMLGAFAGANLSPTQSAQLDLIRQSVAAQEPGRGHMVELLKSLVDGTEESPKAD